MQVGIRGIVQAKEELGAAKLDIIAIEHMVRELPESREIIRHVHFKDISEDKQWRPMGEGVIDHAGVVRLLSDMDYSG